MRVRLLEPLTPYRKGEVADLDDELAAVLLEEGRAVAIRSAGPEEVAMLETPENASARRPRGRQRGPIHDD